MIFSSTQVILLIVPPILVGTTYMVFKYLAQRLGAQSGYLGGFLFYWLGWCFVLPLLLLGSNGFGAMFKAVNLPLGDPAWLSLMLLIGPPLIMSLTTFPARIKAAGFTVIIISILYAIANGTLEEVLWRGTYVSVFPDNWLLGYLYPSIWFGLWHLSPQAVYPSKMGKLSFALMAITLGLVWGYIVMKTGSVRWVIVAHIVLNFVGLPGFSFVRHDSVPA